MKRQNNAISQPQRQSQCGINPISSWFGNEEIFPREIQHIIFWGAKSYSTSARINTYWRDIFTPDAIVRDLHDIFASGSGRAARIFANILFEQSITIRSSIMSIDKSVIVYAKSTYARYEDPIVSTRGGSTIITLHIGTLTINTERTRIGRDVAITWSPINPSHKHKDHARHIEICHKIIARFFPFSDLERLRDVKIITRQR